VIFIQDSLLIAVLQCVSADFECNTLLIPGSNYSRNTLISSAMHKLNLRISMKEFTDTNDKEYGPDCNAS
jgi:hypothetical protein